jgi:3-deoxy-manno-octulosonate cytidylyltransferase (CMP-KDO synthetase)
MGHSQTSAIAVIPARWASTRFPGKVLAEIAGEPMISHVVRHTAAAQRIGDVVVATDDSRIAEVAVAAGAEAVMTGECSSGTDRIAEAVLDRPDWELAVNVQGDEPLIAPANIDTLVAGMLDAPEVGIATLCRPLDPERLDDPNAVKVVRTISGRALYFSRSPVPYPRRPERARELWRLHLGIYGFRRQALRRFVELDPSPLERAEGLEQLRALENGMEILVLDAPHAAIGVDTPEDLERVKQLLERGVF